MSRQRFDSVWDAIEDTAADAASMKARSAIMMALQEEIATWNASRMAVAARLGLTEPRLDELLRGTINLFTLDALTGLATAAGLEVTWHIARKAA